MMDTELSLNIILPDKIDEIEECDITESLEEYTTTSDTSIESDEYNRNLHLRILQLRETIHNLKGQLQEEREIWKRELEDKRDCEYYKHVHPMSYEYYNVDQDYQRYQDTIMQTHYENRQMIQKQIAFSNYKRRLLEVENMCNLELLRVKQSVQILQPLQILASEWKYDKERGDGVMVNKICAEIKDKNAPSEVTMPLENLGKLLLAKKESNISIEKTQSQPNLIISDVVAR